MAGLVGRNLGGSSIATKRIAGPLGFPSPTQQFDCGLSVLEIKVGRVVVVEQLLPPKDGFGFAAGAGMVLTVWCKRRSWQDSVRVAACFLKHGQFNLAMSEVVAAFRALEHPTWHWRRHRSGDGQQAESTI